MTELFLKVVNMSIKEPQDSFPGSFSALLGYFSNCPSVYGI